MKEVVIHIGPHKTGTTSIQEVLNGYSDQTTKYAALGSSNHSQYFTGAFSGSYESSHLFQHYLKKEKDLIRQRFRSKLKDELSSGFSAYERIIFSGESVSALTESELKELHSFLLIFAEKVTIVAYCREPISLTSSIFQQVVKGGKCSFDIKIKKYRDYFEKFLNVFGHNNVIIRPFDKELFFNGSLIADFSNILNLKVLPNASSNVSLSFFATKLLFAFNQKSLTTGQIQLIRARRKLVRIISAQLKGPSFTLPESMIIEKLDYNDLEWLKDNVKIDFTHIYDTKDSAASNEVVDFEKKLLEFSLDEVKSVRTFLRSNGVRLLASDSPADLLQRFYYKLYVAEFKADMIEN